MNRPTRDMSRMTILGAAPDTNNLGVRALLASTLGAVDASRDHTEFTVFDNGFGVRSGEIDVGGTPRPVELIGARKSKKLHRGDTMAHIAVRSYVATGSNPAASAVERSGAALDISAGDSFSDIYGWGRYGHTILQKQLCLSLGTPLVLLPQTYGPYSSKASRRLAEWVVRRADVAIARDPDSFDHLQELLGPAFDETRHRLGVDVAFGLRPTTPAIDDDLEEFFERNDGVIGVNVSGLLYLDSTSKERFELADDYRTTVLAVVGRLLENTDAGVLLVPHVVSPRNRPESDIEACARVAAEFAQFGPRVSIAPPPTTASQAKGLIARTSWFTGSRMHATIAALSSAVPTAALAYSGKAQGVFDSAGAGEHVIDLRRCTAEVVAERALWSFRERVAMQDSLRTTIPAVCDRAVAQIGEALDIVASGSGPR